jgi:hypothetical protein
MRHVFCILLLSCIALVGPQSRASDAVSKDAVDAVIKTDPIMHFVLKDKSGNALGVNKCASKSLTVFVITDKGQTVQTIAADVSRNAPAVFKDEVTRVLVTPGSKREVNGQVETIPAVYETRLRKVCVKPEYTDYMLDGKTVLRYTPFEVGDDNDKTAPIVGKMTIGDMDYDVIQAFKIIADPQ